MTGSKSSSFQPSRIASLFNFGPFSVLGNTRQQCSKVAGGNDDKATRRGRKRKGGKRKQKSFADIVGHDVEIPGTVFGVNVPGLFYTGRVLKKDSSHPNAVTVRCVGDNVKYWLPVDQVRQFAREEKERQHEREARGDVSADQRHDLSAASDQYAASVLVSMSGDRSARSRSVEVKSLEEDNQTSREREASSSKGAAWNMLTTEGVGWRDSKPFYDDTPRVVMRRPDFHPSRSSTIC